MMMTSKSSSLNINLLTSKAFNFSPPLIISEARKRGHKVAVFAEEEKPSIKDLLSCDVYIDYSAITSASFYKDIQRDYQRHLSLGEQVPLMIDPPEAVINSMDKRNTHVILSEFIPESYNLDGLNNEELINRFKDDKYVVIKDPLGWQSKGVNRLSPNTALKKYGNSKDLIVQKYIPYTDGVGRILTLNHNNDFKIICAYLRIPNSWKTDEDDYKCKLAKITKDLSDFAQKVSRKSGLYLNGIDYVYYEGKYLLLEVNAAPGIKEPYDEFNIDTAKILFDHIERNV